MLVGLVVTKKGGIRSGPASVDDFALTHRLFYCSCMMECTADKFGRDWSAFVAEQDRPSSSRPRQHQYRSTCSGIGAEPTGHSNDSKPKGIDRNTGFLLLFRCIVILILFEMTKGHLDNFGAGEMKLPRKSPERPKIAPLLLQSISRISIAPRLCFVPLLTTITTWCDPSSSWGHLMTARSLTTWTILMR
jgi:hypothetical protein